MARLDDRLIEMLYGAVDDGARWVGLMDHLRLAMGVESVAAQFLMASRDDLLPLWGTRDSLSESRGALHDSWANSLANPRFRRPVGPPQDLEIDSDHQSQDYTAQERRDLREGLARCGLGPAFWISQQIDAERHFTLIFHRAADDGRDMEAQDRAMLMAMAPHFRQAVRLWVRLCAAEAHGGLVDQAADGLTTGLIACDRRLRVQWMNAEARRLLHKGDIVRLRHGAIACSDRDDHDRLAALAGTHGDCGVVALGDALGGGLHVRARPAQPMPGQFVLPADLVLLMITRPDGAIDYDPGQIARLFGLTRTEAALAADLATGRSVRDFAATRGVAEGTARLHLKRIMAKTGTSRQADLVRRICLSVAGRPI